MPAAKAKSINEILKKTTLALEGGFVLNGRVEAERILERVTGLKRAELYLERERLLSEDELRRIEAAVSERLSGRPLQYVLGEQQFRYLTLKCREGVLIPRPETELLVDAALEELKLMQAGGLPAAGENVGKNSGRQLEGTEVAVKEAPGKLVVLDIGTGSGAIALSIAKECAGCDVVASDVSDEALELTRQNAALNGLENRVRIVKSDIFDGLGELKGKLDMIVSNPPYIPSKDMAGLQREVGFEPRRALDGGPEGLDFYRRIVAGAGEFLKPSGVLLFEIGFDQGEALRKILEAAGYAGIEILKDYAGHNRIAKAKRI